ncbi:MAG: leucine-rich repeat domain-containing protein [Christensenellales bacterium]
MKRRSLFILLVVIVLVVSTFLLVACKNNNKDNIDDGSSDNWKGDSNSGTENNEHESYIDVSQYLTYKLEGNSYVVTGLTEEGYGLVRCMSLYDFVSIFSYNTYLKNISINQTIQKGVLTIPSEYNGKAVTSIKIEDESMAGFAMCSGLISVSIPDSITSIGEGVFLGCSGLTNLTLPDTITSIGDIAFYFCSSLTTIIIPNAVTYIGEGAFGSCVKLTKVTLGKRLESVGYGAFEGCCNLLEVCNKSSLDIVAGESSNGSVAYYAKNVYTDDIHSNLTTDQNGYIIYSGDEESMLLGYTGQATNLTLPNNITKINQFAFGNYWAILGIYCNFNYEYFNNPKIKNVILPDSIIDIDDFAFVGCVDLEKINMPNGVKSIGEEVFSGCSSLQNISIPASVTSIGETVFRNCRSLKSIKVDVNNTRYHSSGNCLIETESKTLLQGCQNSVIPTGGSVTSIAQNAFFGCNNLTGIVIPKGVESIGYRAFWQCENLEDVTIAESVDYIETSAFMLCTKLTTINYLGTMSDWNEVYKVYGWDYFTAEYVVECDDGQIQKDSIAKYYNLVHKDDGYEVVGFRLIGMDLSEIEIPDNYNGEFVKSIGEDAFSSSSNITEVYVPYGVNSIGAGAFRNCSNLTQITIASSVKSIGAEAFKDCSSLETIIFDGTIKRWASISKGKDWDNNTAEYTVICDDGNLEWTDVIYSQDDDVYIVSGYKKPQSELIIANTYCGRSVISIATYAFSDCSELTTITIPNSVTRIFSYAFNNCSNLTTIIFQGTMEQWNAIDKMKLWDNGTGNYVIHCTDGDIAKE